VLKTPIKIGEEPQNESRHLGPQHSQDCQRRPTEKGLDPAQHHALSQRDDLEGD